jgi:hypothetical protein
MDPSGHELSEIVIGRIEIADVPAAWVYSSRLQRGLVAL